MSAQDGGAHVFRGPIIVALEGHVAPVAVDGEGVLTLDLAKGTCFIIATGSEVKGIRYLNKPELLVDDANNCVEMAIYMLQAEDDGIVFIVHESPDVPAEERIDVDDAQNTVIDGKRVQVFIEPWRGGVGRTRVHDWAGV